MSSGAGSRFGVLGRLRLDCSGFRMIGGRYSRVNVRFLSAPSRVSDLSFLYGFGLPFVGLKSKSIAGVPFLHLINDERVSIILSAKVSCLNSMRVTCHALVRTKTGDISLLRYAAGCPYPVRRMGLQTVRALGSTFRYSMNCSSRAVNIRMPITTMTVKTRVVRGRFALSGRVSNPSRGTSLGPRRLGRVIITVHRVRRTLNSNVGRPGRDRGRVSRMILGHVITTAPVGRNRILSTSGVAIGHDAINLGTSL